MPKSEMCVMYYCILCKDEAEKSRDTANEFVAENHHKKGVDVGFYKFLIFSSYILCLDI